MPPLPNRHLSCYRLFCRWSCKTNSNWCAAMYLKNLTNRWRWSHYSTGYWATMLTWMRWLGADCCKLRSEWFVVLPLELRDQPPLGHSPTLTDLTGGSLLTSGDQTVSADWSADGPGTSSMYKVWCWWLAQITTWVWHCISFFTSCPLSKVFSDLITYCTIVQKIVYDACVPVQYSSVIHRVYLMCSHVLLCIVTLF